MYCSWEKIQIQNEPIAPPSYFYILFWMGALIGAGKADVFIKSYSIINVYSYSLLTFNCLTYIDKSN